MSRLQGIGVDPALEGDVLRPSREKEEKGETAKSYLANDFEASGTAERGRSARGDKNVGWGFLPSA